MMKLVSTSTLLMLFLTLITAPIAAASNTNRQTATPAPASCATATPAATPAMGRGSMTMDMEIEFDQLYIDMMLPHHGSIVAMAQAALPRLADERLRSIAQTIIDTQSAEQAELSSYREQFYGSTEPAPMEMMMAAMPGMGSMDAMMAQMDAAGQVAAICAAEETDVAFIDLTIPHHQMAIAASQTALTEAVHPEIAAFAQRVIDDQSVEIDALTAIRAELVR